MQFPEYRPRRMRRSDGLRRMIRETRLSVDNLVYPIFVCPGRDTRRPISSMPGQAQVSVDQAVIEAKECFDLGIPSVILFGVPDDAKKDRVGSDAWNGDGLVQQACRAIKRACPELVVIL
ncbi:MAG TPA: porphobilinogen synthase, partial [Pseudomonadota bacterium]|nr:porphobilinogen synthase [Pseudomonadota bacterium]